MATMTSDLLRCIGVFHSSMSACRLDVDNDKYNSPYLVAHLGHEPGPHALWERKRGFVSSVNQCWFTCGRSLWARWWALICWHALVGTWFWPSLWPFKHGCLVPYNNTFVDGSKPYMYMVFKNTRNWVLHYMLQMTTSQRLPNFPSINYLSKTTLTS